MNKTLKTIAIVFLVLGALAVIGGVAFGFAGRPVTGRTFAANRPQNFPRQQPRGGLNTWNNRSFKNEAMVFTHRGFFGVPSWAVGSGLTFLIAGAVLLIFNKKIMASVETTDTTVQKTDKKAIKEVEKKATETKKISRKTPSKA